MDDFIPCPPVRRTRADHERFRLAAPPAVRGSRSTTTRVAAWKRLSTRGGPEATRFSLHRYGFFDRCGAKPIQRDRPSNRQRPWPQLPTSTARQPTIRAHPGMGCVLRPTYTPPNAKMTSVCAGHWLGGAPRRNRTGDPILTMEPPGTAVRTAVSPGHARPSRPKLSVLFRRSYAFSFRTR
jgi:hypothetical protein